MRKIGLFIESTDASWVCDKSVVVFEDGDAKFVSPDDLYVIEAGLKFARFTREGEATRYVIKRTHGLEIDGEFRLVVRENGADSATIIPWGEEGDTKDQALMRIADELNKSSLHQGIMLSVGDVK